MTKDEAVEKVKNLDKENVQIRGVIGQYQNNLNQNVGAIRALVDAFQITNDDVNGKPKDELDGPKL